MPDRSSVASLLIAGPVLVGLTIGCGDGLPPERSRLPPLSEQDVTGTLDDSTPDSTATPDTSPGDTSSDALALDPDRRPCLSPGTLTIGGARARVDGRLDGGRLGAYVASLGDFDGDGDGDLAVSEYFDAASTADDRLHIFYGPLDGLLTTDDADATLTAPGLIEGNVAPVGDVTGDGLPDVAIAASGDDAVYLLTSPPRGSLALADAATYRVTGTLFAASAAGGHDVDGDTQPDLVLGAPAFGHGGALFVVPGPIVGDVDLQGGAPALRLDAERSRERFGATLGLQDLDLDGQVDLLVGAPGSTVSGQVAGCAYVVPGPIAASAAIAELDDVASFCGTAPGATASYQVVPIGDVDGDRRVDIALSSWSHDAQRGGVFVFSGPVARGAHLELGDADTTLLGEPGAEAGRAVAAGDVDGDGQTDLAIGGSAWDCPDGGGLERHNSGVLYVVEGPVARGEIELSSARRYAGETQGDSFGHAVAMLERNGQAAVSIAAGALHGDVHAGSGGAAYVIEAAGAMP